MKSRLDLMMVKNKLVSTRSQAESFIKLGQVRVDGKVIKKPGYFTNESSKIDFGAKQQYVSRAALKLASVADVLKINFDNKTVLDVGSSTGGFTDYAIQHNAKKVVAVDVGTNQLHSKLRLNSKVELHEKTDIRDFKYINQFDLVLIDVSFISATKVLPSIVGLLKNQGQIVVMLKPQFEAKRDQLNKGIVKNSSHRRTILHNFEAWCRANNFVIQKKSDSAIAGEKGNVERFYLLTRAL